ncbi:hypothetical protein KAJ77_04015, partial [bacterium]|nr:hypothetical protein [bacterium]
MLPLLDLRLEGCQRQIVVHGATQRIAGNKQAADHRGDPCHRVVRQHRSDRHRHAAVAGARARRGNPASPPLVVAHLLFRGALGGDGEDGHPARVLPSFPQLQAHRDISNSPRQNAQTSALPYATSCLTLSELLTVEYERLLLLKELLADDGSFYLHCDWNKSHYLRCIVDEVFGSRGILNEIVWQRTSARSDSETYNHIHDVLFFCTKGSSLTWNQQYEPHTAGYVEDKYA